MKLNVKAFAIAMALVWGFGVFVGTWWIIVFSGAEPGETLIPTRREMCYTTGETRSIGAFSK